MAYSRSGVLSLSFSFFLFFFLVFQGRVSLYTASCPGICSVDQANLKLTEIHLPLPPEHWDERHVPPLAGRCCSFQELFLALVNRCLLLIL